MKDVKIYEIRRGSDIDSSYQISDDRKSLFCHVKKLGKYQQGDKFYCVDKSLNRIFFAEVKGKQIFLKENKHLNGWEFKSDGQTYYNTLNNNIFQKFKILDEGIIPDKWKWTRRFGQNQTFYLWNENIDNYGLRLEKVGDLQLIFRKGPAFNNLGQCRKQLIARVKTTEIISEKPAPHLIAFDHHYRQILMAAKTKPFILLAGISGTGKSRLVRVLAYQTCIDKRLQHPERPGNFEMISVKPDWQDSSEIIGYSSRRSGQLKYNVTPFLRFIVKAWRYLHVPFWLCMDEMNLARVEQYFSDYLSISETRRFNEVKIISDPFIRKEDIHSYSREDPDFWLNLGLEKDHPLIQQFLISGITMPSNLIVMGTVNMDETTHSFSRKVLDRALTIEMSDMDMEEGLKPDRNDLQYPSVFIPAHVLTGTLEHAGQAYNLNPTVGMNVIRELKQIYNILSDSPFRFGFRVRDEILLYCYYNNQLSPQQDLENRLDICLDEMILMKILPRIEGNERRCGNIIRNLLEKTAHRFPCSHKKLEQMYLHLENNGYASYWY